MKLVDATLSLAPTDLSNHLACQHVTMLELAAARGQRARPTAGVPNQQALQEKGLAHEAAYIAHLRTQGLSVVDLRGEDTTDAGLARTRAEMAAGVDLIVQAPLLQGPDVRHLWTHGSAPRPAPAQRVAFGQTAKAGSAQLLLSWDAPPATADAEPDADTGAARWSGRADILRRVETPSALGAWSYEVVDTKLARETRGSAILQLCTYTAIVSRLQDATPAHLHIVSPGDPFDEHTFRLDDYLAYYRAVRARFERAVQTTDADTTYPDPAPLCDVCRWWSICDTRRRKDDHLSLVAGLTRLQMHELRQQDVHTLERLGTLPTPLPFVPQRGSVESLRRAHGQARVQLDGRREGHALYELLPLEPDRGLSRLPPPSPGDIFFDLEGDPFAGQSGHEYLFGWATWDASAGDWIYTAHWAVDAAAEKAAFQAFIAFVQARLAQHPDLHIYHYAPYESGALRRLMGRHATCEDEVDRLLRGNVLVDLHTVVRQSVRASVERYSIKELEIFYGFTRATPLRDAAAALRHVEYLLETGQPIAEDDAARATIARYNADDCLSAAALRDWLEARRAEHEDAGRIVLRPMPPSADPSDALTERQAQVRALMDTLLADVPDAPEARTAEQQGRWLTAHLLDFHRREEKSAWWEFYRLADLPEEERQDESKALAGLTFVERLGGTKNCPIDRYTFAPQECDIRAGDELYITPDLRLGKVEALDRDARLVDVKKTAKAAQTHPSSAFGFSLVRSDVLAEALLRLATGIAQDGFDTPASAPARAARDLLLRQPPRLSAGEPLTIPGERIVSRARRVALALDGGVLPIQGPPGAGKTYAGARIICGLVAAGKKVGVTGPNHAVISNLLQGVEKAAAEEGLRVRCVQKAKESADATGEEAADAVIRQVTDNNAVLEALRDDAAQVGAGTPWLWAREGFADAVDVLVIDEAGQMSLANALAVAGAARSLVLLGDPQQLEQPLQGSHPDGAAVSVLQHLLGDHQTIPDSCGLFLGETWRLHPAICAFTSEVFYESRLQSHDGLDRQRLQTIAPAPGQAPEPAQGDARGHVQEPRQTPGPSLSSEQAGETRTRETTPSTALSGAGLWFHAVEHEGNQNHAPEEVEAIARLVAHLLDGSRQWVDAEGVARPLTLDDVLVVAPYNAQVYAIRERVPGVRAGTVDRFQGQEAPIVIYSMTTSSPEEAPRGMEFLYSLNRLNVATSRAQGVVVLIASPRLLQPECQTPRQMRLANAFCRYVELASPLELL